MSAAVNPLLGLAVAVLYGSVAVNKYAMIILPVPNTILFIKTFTILVVVKTLSLFGVITLPAITSAKLHELTPISVVYCLHAGLVLRALMRLSVPMYNTLKRLTPIMVLGAKVFIDRKYPESNVVMSLVLSVSGCVIAAAGDLSFDGQGYIVALACAALQATYMMLAEAQKGKAAGSSSDSSVSLSGSKLRSGSIGDLMGIFQKNSDLSPTGARVEPASPSGVLLTNTDHLTSAEAGFEEKQGASVPIPAWTDTKGSESEKRVSRTSESGGGRVGLSVEGMEAGEAKAAPGGKTSPFEILYYMGLVGCPLLLAAVAYSGELHPAALMFRHQWDILGPVNSVIWMFWIASVEGMLTGCMIWCAQINSALTTSIVGVLKGVFATLLGFFLLGGIKFSVLNLIGICITLIGGSWYTWIGYCSTQKKKAAAGAKEVSISGGSAAVDPVEKTPLLAGSNV